MFIHNPHGASYYVRYSFKIHKMVIFIQVIDRQSIDLFIFCHYHLYNKCHHFMNFVTMPHIITDSVRMMYKHRNVWEFFKKQVMLIQGC